MSKLNWIDEATALEANYGGGDYTVTVLEDMDGGYELSFCKTNTNIAHASEHVTFDQLENEMRKYQPDLRKWRKVDLYD